MVNGRVNLVGLRLFESQAVTRTPPCHHLMLLLRVLCSPATQPSSRLPLFFLACVVKAAQEKMNTGRMVILVVELKRKTWGFLGTWVIIG